MDAKRVLPRIYNNPDSIVDDGLRGYLAAHPDIYAATSDPRVVKHVSAPVRGKVGVVTGGGSGHEPAFLGYIGENIVDAVAVGEIFSSPTAKSFYHAMKAADSGMGVVCLYGNYAGDNMNVRLATQMARSDGIEVRTVIARDDVASAPPDQAQERRGVAGEILMWKVAGAAAARGYGLDDVVRVAEAAIGNCRSIGVGLAPCTIPAVGKPNFSIEPGYMEMGIGHHGEPGREVIPVMSARELAGRLAAAIVSDLPFRRDDRVALLLSGLGATPQIELYVLLHDVLTVIADAGLSIESRYIGNYFTSLDMMGVTLTLMRLDDELASLLRVPARCLGLGAAGAG